MFKIEKSIPAPMPTKGNKYPFKNMEIGDSFFFEKKDFINVRQAMYIYSKKTNTKFTISLWSGTINGYRCWRIK